METAFVPRDELLNAIGDHYLAIERDSILQKEAMNAKLAMAVVTVAIKRVEEERWLPSTAASTMRSMERWLEEQALGTTGILLWGQAILVFEREQHMINKAPLLNIDQIRSTTLALRNATYIAIFWFALLACARLGNLPGVVVQEVAPQYIIYTWAQHKTAAAIGSRSQCLYYWNSEMAYWIYNHLPRGMLQESICHPLANMVASLGIRMHSVRRTGVQVYVDAGLTLEDVMTITLHKSKETLLGYVSYYNPLSGSGPHGGIAASLAPTILQLARRR